MLIVAAVIVAAISSLFVPDITIDAVPSHPLHHSLVSSPSSYSPPQPPLIIEIGLFFIGVFFGFHTLLPFTTFSISPLPLPPTSFNPFLRFLLNLISLAAIVS
jgi:hypothetical protein